MVRVVAAVIRRGDRYLLGLRPELKRHGGLWEFPGGKIDHGESVLDAATRELAEELGIQVTGMGEILLSVADGASPFVIDFVEIATDGAPLAVEHDELGWFDPGEMAAMPLAPADAACARYLAARPPRD